MKCPRCKAAVTTPADATGLIICAKCGARLRSRPGADGAPPAKAGTPRSDTDTIPPGKLSAPKPGSETIPPKPAPSRRPGTETLPGVAIAVAVPEPAPPPPAVDEAPADPEPVAAPLAQSAAPAPLAPPEPPAAAEPSAEIEALLYEIREVRRVQDEILALLRERPGDSMSAPFRESAYQGDGEDDTSPGSQPVNVRSRRRKSVLIIDDDSVSRTVAADALTQADVPVRTVNDGNAGLAAIAQEKPDVVVLELGIAGAMPGKDVVNVIKATMEWVDVPIVLYTRVPIESQKEARTIHGADELVPKGPGAADLLVARVIAIFRKG